MTNLLAGIIRQLACPTTGGDNFLPKKLALKYEIVKTNQFSMFLLIELGLIHLQNTTERKTLLVCVFQLQGWR
jgi:hypothetical protein